jgi:hypothetical protein
MGRAFSLRTSLGWERMWRHWSITRLQVVGFNCNREIKGFLNLSGLAIMFPLMNNIYNLL